MRANITTNIVVTLILSPEEAKWLNAMMQNPGFGVSPEQEEQIDKEMRAKFFIATAIT